MTERIYLLGEDAKLVAMDEAAYDSEDLLQRLLAEHPDLLTADASGGGETPRWLLISREMAVPGETEARAVGRSNISSLIRLAFRL